MAATNGQTLTTEAAEPVQEPSMEDILASIRRIIASDQHIAGARVLGSAPRPAAAPVVPPVVDAQPPTTRTAEAEVPALPDYPGQVPSLDDLEALVQPPAAIEPAPVSASAAEPAPSRREAAAQLHPELFPPPEVQATAEVYNLSLADRIEPAGEAEDLISSAARDQVSSSFHLLADSMLRDPDTIERIARDTLRPMLKTWLDENLPSMVERLVRAEIERVARGGRSRG